MLGAGLIAVTSYFLINPGSTAHASIYWNGGQTADSFFIENLCDNNTKFVYATPITVNTNDGYFVVLQTNQAVPELLEQFKDRFSHFAPENIIVGTGTNAGFFSAKVDGKISGTLLIRDQNINKTIMVALTMPDSVLKRDNSTLTDVDGIDPVIELRPPGSQRVICLETPMMTLAAYKSIDGNLTDFYESIDDNTDISAVSVMAFADKKLPNNGDLFFFDTCNQKGFVVYQSDLKNNCSYSIVCAQMQ